MSEISRASFDKIVPFFVMEQSPRSCLCVHCYKAKLITIALCELWPTLHHGATPGSRCTCECELCIDGSCKALLPYANPQAVFSMGGLSNKLLCDPVFLRTGADGVDVTAHKSKCVSGHCLLCRRKQERFFKCPRNQGDADRVWPPLCRPVSPGNDNNQGPPGLVQWKIFAKVHDPGRTPDPDRRSRSVNGRGGDVDGDDGDWDPRGGADKAREKKVGNSCCLKHLR